MPSVLFLLHETAGNPPKPCGGWCVGAPGDTEEGLIRHIETKYGPRLARIELKNGRRHDYPAPPAVADQFR